MRSPRACGQRVWSCGVAVTPPFEASLQPELRVPLSPAQGTCLSPSMVGTVPVPSLLEREGALPLTLQVVWSCLLSVWKEQSFNHRSLLSREGPAGTTQAQLPALHRNQNCHCPCSARFFLSVPPEENHRQDGEREEEEEPHEVTRFYTNPIAKPIPQSLEGSGHKPPAVDDTIVALNMRAALRNGLEGSSEDASFQEDSLHEEWDKEAEPGQQLHPAGQPGLP